MTDLTITLPTLHDGQQEVASHPARFKVLAAGRRWGKTRLGAVLCVKTALEGGRAWWVAPSYPMATVGWRMIKHLTKQIPGADKREVDRLVTLPSGGQIQVRSADKPDSLRGEGLDLLIVDECAFMREEAWTEALRPALSDRQGRALFISTPKGRNWFWRIFQAGITGDDPNWQSWHLPTASNPHIDSAEVDAAQQQLPDAIFRQEYLAEFIEDAGLVFRKVRDAVRGHLPMGKPQAGHRYVMGVDWAQSHDWTVLVVMDSDTREVVAIDRFNQIAWDVQRGRLRAMADRWHVTGIVAEQNSIGGPNIEALQREGLPVTAFTTTNDTKQGIIVALQLAFERGEIGIPDDTVLISELESFEAARLPSGKWRYEAPSGMHDDMVIALALALEAVNNSGPLVLFGG